GLGDRVVDVDGREQQLAVAGELVEPEDARGGLLADPVHPAGDAGEPLAVLGEAVRERAQQLPVLGVVAVGGQRYRTGGLELDSLVHQQGRVAAVVDEQVRPGAVAEVEQLAGAPPVLGEGFALPREHRHAGRAVRGTVGADDDRRGGLVLRGVDVAGHPAHLRAERGQGLDEHGGLHGHVQRPGDPRAAQRLRRGVPAAQRHQPGHLVFGEPDLVPAGPGERQVRHGEVDAVTALELDSHRRGHLLVGGALAGRSRAERGGWYPSQRLSAWTAPACPAQRVSSYHGHFGPGHWVVRRPTLVVVSTNQPADDLAPLPDLLQGRAGAGPVRTRRPVYLDLLPPCNAGCPAGENIQAWLAEVQAGRYEAAWRELVRDNPMPAIHGRVCYHPCETVCNRAQMDSAVSIHGVELFLGDLALQRGWQFDEPAARSGKRVLVVGAGPSGLSAAYHLARLGHQVEIRDA